MNAKQRERRRAMARTHTEHRDGSRLLPDGWTKAKLADELDVSRQVLHRWLTGRAPWPPARLTEAARLLGVEESTLVPGG